MNPQDCDRKKWFFWIASVMEPRIGCIGFRVSFQAEDFDDPIPNRLALECFVHRDALKMRGFNPMQFVDRVPEFFDYSHGFLSGLISNLTMKGVSSAGVSMAAILAIWEDIFARKSIVPR